MLKVVINIIFSTFQQMKGLKEKRKSAVERQNVSFANKYEEEYNEYKAEYKKEKKILDASTADLDVLMLKLEHLDRKLDSLKVEFRCFADLCKLFNQLSFCSIKKLT